MLEFVEWLQEGILDNIISVETAERMYSARYSDFDGDDFYKFIFSK